MIDRAQSGAARIVCPAQNARAPRAGLNRFVHMIPGANDFGVGYWKWRTADLRRIYGFDPRRLHEDI